MLSKQKSSVLSRWPCYPKLFYVIETADFHIIQRFPCYSKISLLSNRQIVKLVLPPPLIHTSLVALWSSLRPHLPSSLYRVSCVWFGQNQMKPNIRGLKLYKWMPTLHNANQICFWSSLAFWLDWVMSVKDSMVVKTIPYCTLGELFNIGWTLCFIYELHSVCLSVVAWRMCGELPSGRCSRKYVAGRTINPCQRS